MPGIYFHIPFCKKFCHYCDFYKTRSLALRKEFFMATQKELVLQKNYFPQADARVKSIYFGGGTPSLMKPEQIEQLIRQVFGFFPLEKKVEITVEANPEDLSVEYLSRLKEAGVNRLSIGCQSFTDDVLKKMNRRHNARQAIEGVKLAEKAGFTNISIDLIYGFPGMTIQQWKEQIKTALELPIRHISAYHLTIEPGTVFRVWEKQGKLKMPDEKTSVAQYELLLDYSDKAGYEHYEISSFAKNGKYSVHNMIYWFQESYLGIGPSAHSYNGYIRSWNPADLKKYLENLRGGCIQSESEMLDQNTMFNEYLMTRLRTKWGINPGEIEENFGSRFVNKIAKDLKKLEEQELLQRQDGRNFALTPRGMFISDTILAGLFMD